MPVATMFFDYEDLYEHFESHGSDFACTDESDYLQKCKLFLNADKSLHANIQECERKDGDIVRFDARTNEFGIMSISGIIRTYYKPLPRHIAPTGYVGKTHAFLTNQLYFEDNCKK